MDIAAGVTGTKLVSSNDAQQFGNASGELNSIYNKSNY